LRNSAEHRGTFQALGSAAQAPGARRQARSRAAGLPALAAALLLTVLFAGPAVAANFDFDRVPDRFQYARYAGSLENKPRTVAFRRNESRHVVAAPTRFRVSSILRYSTPLGDTGLVLRVKAPLKPRKIVSLEIRF
jgi:hypothetical protein